MRLITSLGRMGWGVSEQLLTNLLVAYSDADLFPRGKEILDLPFYWSKAEESVNTETDAEQTHENNGVKYRKSFTHIQV